MLVRRFTTANAMPQPRVPWYEAAVAYGTLLPGVLTWFVGIPVFLSYWSCAENNRSACAAASLLDSSTGDYTGIIVSASVVYFVALLTAIVVQFTVRKLYFPIVWGVALLSTGSSLVAYGIMSGLLGTPWGHLIPGS